MFGSLNHLIPPANATAEPPKDVPPATQINFPRCHLRVGDGDLETANSGTPSRSPSKPLSAILQGIVRPTEVKKWHLEALGVHVIPDVGLADLIPDPAYIPDFDAWDKLSVDKVFTTNASTQKPLNTGNLSPGCQIYVERKRELSIANEAAFRAVRRITPPKGQTQARLGNSYEFFRHLELFSTFWDDTSQPTPSPTPKLDDDGTSEAGKGDGAASLPEQSKRNGAAPPDFRFYRTGAGHQMPPEYRQNIIQSFVKMIAYDFGCNVSAPRTEPRLYVTSNPSSSDAAAGAPPHPSPPTSPRSSYFSSGCTFIFRTPTTREAARAGIVEGPLATVSARHTTSFPPPRETPASPSVDATATPFPRGNPQPASVVDRESLMDFGRELIAAIITAQHRARQGRTEKRIGEGEWWATKPRWGGGPGGPIGREVEMAAGLDETVGDKDEPLLAATAGLVSAPSPDGSRAAAAAAAAAVPPPPRRPPPHFPLLPSGIAMGFGGGGPKGPKRFKRSGNLPMYDNYRMVRPPAATWDRRTRYTAIGRARAVDYDDIFVVSVLFHHVSVLRVRVPDRLLAVLDGAADDDGAAAEGNGTTSPSPSPSPSWRRLEVRRSRWHDLFKAEDRVAAMQMIWSMMAYLMRAETGEEEVEGDARMRNA